MKSASFFLFLAMLGVVRANAVNPTLYFTDLTSGPVGAIVTVYGANLVPSVTVNSVAATIVLSSASKVSFVIPNVASGSIKVASSNALPFTVRAGSIHYVATNGSDSNAGTAAAPWLTIPYAFNTAACGDVIYAKNGVSQTTTNNYDASLSVERVCSQTSPLALVGYPGATVTIGSATGAEFGIRNPNLSSNGWNGFVFANLVLRGSNSAIANTGNMYWRIVGNDMSCPDGSGEAACAMMDQSSYIEFLGNSIHNSGAGGTKYYHSFYGTTNTNNVEVGWNDLYNNNSCRGIQFYSTSGNPQYNLIVHDNIITGQECDGINFATVNAAEGPIEAYNNLVYHVGLGGTKDGTSNYACIDSPGYGTPGGTALFYGNTLADCGSYGGSTAGAITVMSGSPQVLSTSNLIIQSGGEAAYSPNTTSSLITSSHDVVMTGGITGVVSSTTYQPVAGSPAIGTGIAQAGILWDLAGNPRPQSGASDAGAYLWSSASTTAQAPTAVAPTGFSATVVSTGVNFAWSYSSTIAPACSTTVKINCVTEFELTEGSTVLKTVAATTATAYAYTLTPLPAAGTYSYTLTPVLASGSTTVVAQPVTATVTISPVSSVAILTVVLTGTRSTGTTFSISAPITLSADPTVTGLKSITATVTGKLPDGNAISASGALTVK